MKKYTEGKKKKKCKIRKTSIKTKKSKIDKLEQLITDKLIFNFTFSWVVFAVVEMLLISLFHTKSKNRNTKIIIIIIIKK